MSNSRRNDSRRNNNRKNAPQSQAKAKRTRSRKIGIIIADIQLVLTFVFLGLLIMLNVLPSKYLMAVILILVFFVAYAFLSQFTRRYKLFGKILSVIISIVLIMGSYYLIKTNSMLSNISGAGSKTDEMSIIVLKDDPAQSIKDTENYTYGINEIIDREKSDEVVEKISDLLDSNLDIKAYSGYDSLVTGLYAGESQVIIFNEAFRELIHDDFADFDDRTRVLDQFEVESAIPTPEANGIDVTNEPFHVLISGIDTSGSISTTSRSDVNIIATINPTTHQVLLTTTPRDYFVPLPNSGGVRDKLTHAGIYGVDVSVGALEDLYNIDIDYYARVNFTTLISLVDALGGISAYSEYSFSSGGYSFQQGYNDMDGEKALVFSRERYAFNAAGGDMQRGRNQMEVIKGIINKAVSPAIITNYGSVMDSIEGSFETNMHNDKISNLIKMQIDKNPSWNIVSSNVVGHGESRHTFSQSQKSSVLIPNEESVQEAKEKIYATMDGTTLTQE